MNWFNFIKSLMHRNESKSFVLPDKSVTEIHQQKGSTHYVINIPGHNARTESDIFVKTRHHLVAELDTPCWVCGSKIDRQVHHFILEYSLQNAVDWGKVKALHPDFPDWDKIDPNDQSTFKHFTDHEYNMMVLCGLHHTRSQGIHVLPYPIWNFLKIKKDDFEFIPQTKGFDFPVDDLS